MARYSLFTLAVVAIGVLGANAGPCRPTTVTSLTETSSVATVETSSTSLAETSSRSLPETTTTLVETLSTTTTETSSQTLSETSSTTLETSTTSEAPSCVETQVVVNPSFDDNNGAPWTGSGSTTTNNPNSGSHAWIVNLFNGFGSANFAQTLNNLDGNYRLTYFYHAASWVNGGAGFSCTIQPKVGEQSLPSVDLYEISSWMSDTQTWSSGGEIVAQAELSFGITCYGEFDQLTIAFDDVTFTQVCDGQQS
ncbi:hypothetical protein B0J15DRAFT_529950 [Fusarium solani]|uniref:CBM-cenC domain-containing protein n=1 Tax=Fusarium solani TaxID=169388 RepID=A0A9P9G8P7_FUSSL|nr:uncharacterized protein B0J15DRAFT_529950 [Fusarium solani]KAH7234263.1 hypothetical protein B0J15DRAFT_529950 [Fusarium solani]